MTKPPPGTRVLRGRPMTTQDIATIQTITGQTERNPTREAIARAVCDALDWRRPDGAPHVHACLAALRRLEREGTITLPEPKGQPPGPYRGPKRLPTPPKRDWPAAIIGPLDALHVRLVPVAGRGPDHRLYRDLLARFHYLGYSPIRGAQLRYRIDSDAGILGFIAFGSAAWRVTVRDRFIGWDDQARLNNLPLVVQNVRFLLLPWVKVPNLASNVLAIAARQMSLDWHARYGLRPLLLETFVDSYQFAGTSYRAQGWVHVGQTIGRGRNDRRTRLRRHLPEKDVYLYPLAPGWRKALNEPRPASLGSGVRVEP